MKTYKQPIQRIQALRCLSLGGMALILTACSNQPPPARGGMVVNVVAVDAQERALTETMSLIGSVTPNESVDIKSRTSGAVAEIGFDEGQRVEKGHLLFQIDEQKLAATVSQKQASFGLAEKNAERSRTLLADRTISQQEFDQSFAEYEVSRANLELAEQELREATVIAPFGGIMGSRMVSPGQVVEQDRTLSTLVDLDTVKIEFNVPERSLEEVRVGQVLTLSVPAFADREFQGEVYFIASKLDTETRTALVKARVNNSDLSLRPGMLATIDLTLQVHEEAVLVPEASLIAGAEGYTLYVVNAEGAAEIRAVKTGLRQAGFVQILSGVTAGEKVIVEGTQKIGPGVKVALASSQDSAVYESSPILAAAR